MKKLLEYLIKSIVSRPEKVKIKEEKMPGSEEGVLLKISCAEEDKGIVIGKGGKTIYAIRNIVRMRAIKEGKRVWVELEE